MSWDVPPRKLHRRSDNVPYSQPHSSANGGTECISHRCAYGNPNSRPFALPNCSNGNAYTGSNSSTDVQSDGGTFKRTDVIASSSSDISSNGSANGVLWCSRPLGLQTTCASMQRCLGAPDMSRNLRRVHQLPYIGAHAPPNRGTYA